jgi:hypothetical protein
VLLALVVSSAALAALPPAASAALHPGQYTLNTLTLHDSSSGPVGSYLKCKNPSNQRIVTGGSFWHAKGQGPDPSNASSDNVGSSVAALHAKGWYADGFASVGRELTITALCLPKSQVGTYTVKTTTFDVLSGNAAGGYVSCPPNQRIVTGGAFWHQPGKGPDPNLASNYFMGSSSATFNAKGWYADGWTLLDSQLTITAMCLPMSRIGNYTLKQTTVNQASGGFAGGYLKCPRKQRIVAGGAFWHQPGMGPDPSNALNDMLGSSAATFDAKGWYADGQASFGSSSLQLTIVAQCLPM